MITWSEYVQFTDTTAAYPGAEIRDGHTVPDYVRHGLVEEIGELHGVHKRRLRDDGGEWTQERLAHLRGEIGDCLWYCARYVQHYGELEEYEHDILACSVDRVNLTGVATWDWWEYLSLSVWSASIDDTLYYLRSLAAVHGWTLAEIASENMAKLCDRKARGVIQGKGGDR